MKFTDLAKAISRFSRVIGIGMSTHGRFYRYYLLLLGLGFGGVITRYYWNTGNSWLGCSGEFEKMNFFCYIPAPTFPIMGGVSLGLALVVLSAVIVGLPKFLRLIRFERAFQVVGLKNSLGMIPMAIDLHVKKDKSQWLTIKSDGVSVDNFKSKARELETSLGLGIDTVESGPNPSILRVSLFSSAIPRVCEYEKLKDELNSPYSFLVGKSALNAVMQSISSLPHLLIAGTTGGGKSIFFKQVLLSLLNSSPRIQMYLFDLKGGVELNVFSRLPNVQVYKSEAQALKALEVLNKEMDRRLEYLASREFTKVDFERDKLDMIVVGVDEASELYGKSTNKAEQKVVERARELTDRLTKLARATGIHVILATQKVLKETIDTKVQENIGGRMIFRMNTLHNSMNVLGNKMAYELPDIPGRAIWSSGNKFTEVQAPLLSDETLKKSLTRIAEDFEEDARKNFGQILCPVMKSGDIEEGTIAQG